MKIIAILATVLAVSTSIRMRREDFSDSSFNPEESSFRPEDYSDSSYHSDSEKSDSSYHSDSESSDSSSRWKGHWIDPSTSKFLNHHEKFKHLFLLIYLEENKRRTSAIVFKHFLSREPNKKRDDEFNNFPPQFLFRQNWRETNWALSKKNFA